MNAEIVETDETLTVVDEYGDAWEIVADDGCGNLAIERDAGERWEAGSYSGGTISPGYEGDTFGVTCQADYILVRVDNAGSLRWKHYQD